MKSTVIRPLKIFCFIFIILLVMSNVSVYGQRNNHFLLSPSIDNIKSYRENFLNYINTIEHNFKYHSPDFWKNSSMEHFNGALYKYRQLIMAEDNILSYTRALDVADKEVIDIVVYNRYLANDSDKLLSTIRLEDEIVFNKLKTLLEFIKSKSSFKYKTFLTSGKLIGAKKEKEFENCIKYFQNRFDENFYKTLERDVERYNKEIYSKVISFFREAAKPEDIMEYAFKNSLLPQEKAGIKLTLEAMDSEVSLSKLVKSIRGYLVEFGSKVKNVKYYPVSSLTKALQEMDIIERTRYVDEITELKSGSKNFVKDFEKLGKAEQKYVGRNITKGFWFLSGVGAVLTAAYISDISADNHFSAEYTLSNRDLVGIGRKIENGTASIEERFEFFINPVTEEYVKKDPVYTLNFVDLVSNIYTADKLLETLKTQEQQVQDKVEKSLYNNLDRRINNTDFGTGNL